VRLRAPQGLGGACGHRGQYAGGAVGAPTDPHPQGGPGGGGASDRAAHDRAPATRPETRGPPARSPGAGRPRSVAEPHAGHDRAREGARLARGDHRAAAPRLRHLHREAGVLMPPTPFRSEIPDAVLADLRERLARARWPDQAPGPEWTYGASLAYLKEL